MQAKTKGQSREVRTVPKFFQSEFVTISPINNTRCEMLHGTKV